METNVGIGPLAGPEEHAARATAEAVARAGYGKLIALLAARTRDPAAAEDALSEAFAAALAEWPRNGIPDKPEAWLLTVARRKMIDGLRRRQSHEAASDMLKIIAEELDAEARDRAEIPDHRLALMFACAHPAIPPDARAPLVLQTVLGFDAARIATAFLMAPSTMGQRLVRAKAKIRDASIPFRVPDRTELAQRLEPVLSSVYAAYTAGWSDLDDQARGGGGFAEEAIWLGRLIVSLLPEEAEALGLLALMLHAEARRAARRNACGDYVPLSEQDVKLWNAGLIEEAERLLFRARGLGAVGRYQLEAAVQSAHAVRRFTQRSDWSAIEQLYDALIVLTGSPVAMINRAIAIAETRGVASGLAALDEVAADPRVQQYQPYWAARAELLGRTDDKKAAHEAYQQAIELETDPAIRRFLQQRQANGLLKPS